MTDIFSHWRVSVSSLVTLVYQSYIPIFEE